MRVKSQIPERSLDLVGRWCHPLFRAGFEPSLDKEKDPTQLGVLCYPSEHEIMIDAVKEGPDVEIDHPVEFPASLPGAAKRIKCRTPRAISIGVGVKDRFHFRLQIDFHHRLSNPVRYGRYPENS